MSHNAFQRSEELEGVYQRLVSQRRVRYGDWLKSGAHEFSRIYTRATEGISQEAQKRREQTSAFSKQLNLRLSTFKTELSQGVDAFRQQTRTFETHSMQQLEQLARQDANQIRTLSSGLQQYATGQGVKT